MHLESSSDLITQLQHGNTLNCRNAYPNCHGHVFTVYIMRQTAWFIYKACSFNKITSEYLL